MKMIHSSSRQVGNISPPSGLSLAPLPGGLAFDRLSMPIGAQSLNGLAAPIQLTGQFQQVHQCQQLLQLMSLLLALMQNQSGGPQAAATDASALAGLDSTGGSGFQGGTKDSSGAQAAGDPSAKAGSTVMRQGKPIGAQIATQFDNMVAAAKQDGVNITITSGARSRAEQERLYAAYKNGTGNLAAKPGTSNHESGEALDLGPPSAYAWLKQNAGRFCFKNKIASEPWHWSLTGN